MSENEISPKAECIRNPNLAECRMVRSSEVWIEAKFPPNAEWSEVWVEHTT